MEAIYIVIRYLIDTVTRRCRKHETLGRGADAMIGNGWRTQCVLLGYDFEFCETISRLSELSKFQCTAPVISLCIPSRIYAENYVRTAILWILNAATTRDQGMEQFQKAREALQSLIDARITGIVWFLVIDGCINLYLIFITCIRILFGNRKLTGCTNAKCKHDVDRRFLGHWKLTGCTRAKCSIFSRWFASVFDKKDAAMITLLIIMRNNSPIQRTPKPPKIPKNLESRLKCKNSFLLYRSHWSYKIHNLALSSHAGGRRRRWARTAYPDGPHNSSSTHYISFPTRTGANNFAGM